VPARWQLGCVVAIAHQKDRGGTDLRSGNSTSCGCYGRETGKPAGSARAGCSNGNGSTSKNKELRKAATEQENARDGCAFAFPAKWTTGVAGPLRMKLLHRGAVGTEVGNLIG
jgi:hypothetical protein